MKRTKQGVTEHIIDSAMDEARRIVPELLIAEAKTYIQGIEFYLRQDPRNGNGELQDPTVHAAFTFGLVKKIYSIRDSPESLDFLQRHVTETVSYIVNSFREAKTASTGAHFEAMVCGLVSAFDKFGLDDMVRTAVKSAQDLSDLSANVLDYGEQPDISCVPYSHLLEGAMDEAGAGLECDLFSMSSALLLVENMASAKGTVPKETVAAMKTIAEHYFARSVSDINQKFAGLTSERIKIESESDPGAFVEEMRRHETSVKKVLNGIERFFTDLYSLDVSPLTGVLEKEYL